MKQSVAVALLVALGGTGCRTEQDEMPRLASVAGAMVDLYTAASGTINAIAGWTPDGRTLLFTTARNYPDPPVELWHVSRTGGDAALIGEIPDWRVDGPALHPDGQTTAFRAGQTRGEIWALDGAMPVDAGSSRVGFPAERDRGGEIER